MLSNNVLFTGGYATENDGPCLERHKRPESNRLQDRHAWRGKSDFSCNLEGQLPRTHNTYLKLEARVNLV